MKKIQLATIKRMLKEPVDWIGLPEEDFTFYKPYVNRQNPGICGTYAAAALSHYAVGRLNGQPFAIPQQSMDEWIQQYQPLIDDGLPYNGTFWWDVVRGLKKRLAKQTSYHIRCKVISERAVVRVLNSDHPMPVIVGTLNVFGSPYRNHWLLVYAFAYDSNGKLWFKAYDNHGNTQAVLPASQTIFAIWLEK